MKRLKSTLFYIIIVFYKLNTVSAEDEDEVSTPLGKIRGSFMQTRLGERIYSFRGIRYAEPPIGENRFQVKIKKSK